MISCPNDGRCFQCGEHKTVRRQLNFALGLALVLLIVLLSGAMWISWFLILSVLFPPQPTKLPFF